MPCFPLFLSQKVTKRMLSVCTEHILQLDYTGWKCIDYRQVQVPFAPFAPAGATWMSESEWFFLVINTFRKLTIKNKRGANFPANTERLAVWNGLQDFCHIHPISFQIRFAIENQENSNKIRIFFYTLYMIENWTITRSKTKPTSPVYWVSSSLQLSKDKIISSYEYVNTFWHLSAAVTSKSVRVTNSFSCQCSKNKLWHLTSRPVSTFWNIILER